MQLIEYKVNTNGETMSIKFKIVGQWIFINHVCLKFFSFLTLIIYNVK